MTCSSYLCATFVLVSGVNLLAEDSPYKEVTFQYSGGEYKNETMRYRLMSPKKIEEGKVYPLVVFLHGAGERGADNQKQLLYLPNLLATDKMREEFPCFVLAPQCRPGKRWVEVHWGDQRSTPMAERPSSMMSVAIASIKQTLRNHPIDTSRVYLTGLSMGGYGSWELAARHPEWFAAVVPICGGGDENQAKKLASLPIWTTHGDADGAVPVNRTRLMVAAIKGANGNIKYTEYAKAGHNVWNRTYDPKSGVLKWMFSQQRKDKSSR